MTRRVAIIGSSFRFPGTTSSNYWQDLLGGRDLVTAVDPQRWAQEAYRHPNKNHAGTTYTFAAGSIGDVSTFDAAFFGISPREAAQMDPQQRLLLEMSWEALENAGVKPSSLRGSPCGVFIGISSADYSYRFSDDLGAVDSSAATGNTASIAANRISYVLDLQGPSMAIDTACSSSMVSFHQACRSILSGESTQALTGGVSLHLHPYGFIIFSKASMLSRRGRCNVFDADGDGYVRSEGGGIFFLKDYDLAVADGNPILAIVSHSAVNTDGRKSGLTVPSPKAQAALLEQTYRQAGIAPSEIDYVEAHGTGTAVGDPIEARALGDALGKHRPKNRPLLIGSVKSNLGHLEAASGVAGLVKALHCITHRMVPATIGIKTPNPKILLDDWNLSVVTAPLALKKAGRVIVGINSFGFGGANAHVILESPPTLATLPTPTVSDQPLPVVISAKTADGLIAAAHRMAEFLRERPATPIFDLSYNSVKTRDLLDHRAVVYATNGLAVADAFSAFANKVHGQTDVESAVAIAQASGPVFVYSGNGSQWAGMGKRLLDESPVFKAAVREVDVLFGKHADYSLEAELAGENGDDRYDYTEIAQPALFALQVGVTRMLQHRGVMPLAVTGHSVGEVAAAWASGALSLEAAVEVIYHRSQSQGLTKGNGKMTAVALGHTEIDTLLGELLLSDAIAVSGINSARGVTVAGAPDALSTLESALSQRHVSFKRLDLDYAFHSPAMDPIESRVRETLAGITPQRTTVPFYSTVTGTVLEGSALDALYWWHNIRKPVLFESAVRQLIADGMTVFIEIGPHAVLRSYLNDGLKATTTEGSVIPTLNRGDDTPQRVWTAVSQVVLSGATIEWQRVFPRSGNFLQLPNYAWQRERHWHPVTAQSAGLLYRHKIHPLLGYALPQHELTWENQLDTRLNPVLADHVVGDATVFPGTGFAELALAATMTWQTGTIAEIEELEIRSPLILSDDHAMLIRLCIDPSDGSFTIKGREQSSTEPWTLHAGGRILREPRALMLDQEAELVVPDRAPDFNGASHAVLTRAAGLTYGPAFECIDFGWVDHDSALAVLTIPDSIDAELAQTHLHPALLDCTFQLIIQLLKDHVGGIHDVTFVPTKMGRITLRESGARPGYARATLLRRTAHSLTADFTVYDMDGVPIALVKEARFRSVRLSKNAADHLRFLDYHGTPAPHPLTQDSSAAALFEHVQAALAEMARRSALQGSHRRYSEEVDPLLDSLCSRFVRQAMQHLAGDGTTITAADVLAWQSANPSIAPLLDHLLTVATDDQTLRMDNGQWQIQPDHDDSASAQDIWNSLIADYPDYFQIVHAVGRIGMHLPALLAGQTTLAELRPNESSLATLTRDVLGAKGKHKIGLTLRDLIRQAAEQLPVGRRLSIIEVSEGPPAFSMDICASLDFNSGDYTFASTTPMAVEEAGRIKEYFPAIATQSVPLTLTASDIPGRCQIAVVTLDFSDIAQAQTALLFARNHLAPGGTLLAVGQHPSRWIDFVFGGQQAYWSGSADAGWVSNQRPAHFWQAQLAQPEFVRNELFELSPDTLSGPYLLLAQRDIGSVAQVPSHQSAPRSWIVLADEAGYSAQLSDRLTASLQERGDLVIQSHAGSRDEIAVLLNETTERYGQLDGIVHLAGLRALQADAAAERVLDQQVDRCAIAASVIQACETTTTSTTCWLITSDAATTMLPPADLRTTGGIIAVDAALLGFGRTLINEASNYQVRLVDLASGMSLDAMVAALDQEFEQPDAEQEVAINQHGARFAPRLRIEPRPQSPAVQIDTPTITLGFQMPGQLRNLRWIAQPRSVPAEDEIEVDVHATGLNFRDVMYALGMLSDEAIENGFAGPTLGLEFAGIVRSVGSKAKGFAPGDQVVGFGPSSFGNRVLTQANAISHIPPRISFEAAATIPSTFFTVYYALHHLARLQPGEKVLIHGAAGGVGIAAIQLAKWLGAEIYVTAGSDEKRDFLRLLGVDHIYDSRSLAFADEILADTNQQGVDVVLNSLAGEAINRNFRVLKPFGRFLELGKRDFYENTKIGLRPFRNNISYFGIDADQLMQARPELTRTLFSEMMALFADGVLHPLPYHAFEADEIVDAFRYMQQAKQIGKIVITYRNGIRDIQTPPPAAQAHLQLSADASYLVTGGLGGFGLRTAEWLAEKGARHLILISRSGPASDTAKSAIARLEALGVTVHAAACDITNKTALAALLSETRREMPPLKGIVHAATVIHDALVRNMDADQIRSVLAPKMLGAHYLHQLTLDTKLDLFVLFSSATTLLGNPGQGNYVAANACLEALATYRRAHGLAATAVRWGAIDDVGFLARNEKIKDALQSRMGGSALQSAIALDALESMLLADRSGLGVMELDWSALSRFLPSAGSPKFSELARQAGSGDGGDDNPDDMQRALAELSDEDLLATVIDMLKMEVGEILRVAPDKIDPVRSIYDMGLDSLMGVELAVALEARFAIRLPVMALSQSPTIAMLAQRIIGQMRASDDVEAHTEDKQIVAQVQQLVAQHGSETSAESIIELAEAIQSQDASSMLPHITR